MAALQLTYAQEEPNNTHNTQLHSIGCQTQRGQMSVGNIYAMSLILGWLSLTDLDFGLSESLPCMTRVTACAMYSSSQWPLRCEAAVMALTTRADATDICNGHMQQP